MTITFYKRQLEQLYNCDPWFVDSFLGKLNNINDQNAFVRPTGNLHTIAELVAHCFYWRSALIDSLKGNVYRYSMESPNNWRSNEELKAEGWNSLFKNLDNSQAVLLKLLDSFNEEDLQKEFRPNARITDLINGIIQHDIYHLGQIGLTIKLIKQ